MNLRITLFSICLVLVFGQAYSQLSFLTVLDSFPGSDSEFVPLPEGFLTFNGSFEEDEEFAFQMTRFEKCGAVEWTKEFSSDDPFLNTFGSPEAVMDRAGVIYLLLSHEKEQGEGVVLVKMLLNGTIEWSYKLSGFQKTDLYSANNILSNRFTDTLAITLNNEFDNASIIQFSSDGEILNQKQLSGFRFHSSRMDNDGSIIMAGDTSIVKVNSALDLVWAKRLNSHSQFVQSYDPIIELNGQINLVAVDTFGTALDSFYYSLVTLDEDGTFLTNSDGIRGREFGSVDLQQRGNNAFLLLDRGYGTMIEGNTAMISSYKDFAFCADSIEFCSSNMNTCIDNSLLLSGFYYEHPDSVQFFMGKTDPSGALNCDEFDMPLDTVYRSIVQMDSIHYELEELNMNIDSAAYTSQEFTPSQEMPCFLAVVDEQSQDYQPCPCLEQPLAVSWLKGAEYLWSTGDTTNFITVDTSGTFTVDVNLCGTEERSTFNVEYKKITQCLEYTDNSPQCPGLITSLKVLHNYGDQLSLNWTTGETGDSIQVTKEGQYTVNLEACGYTDSITFDIVYRDIEEDECKPVFIPNAFVPKSTMYEDNKVFKVYTKLDASAFIHFDMVVFDRWGEKVYETDDPFIGWDGTYRGKEMPPGVYLYNISYEIDLGGEPFSDSKRGQVVLVK